MAHPEDVTDPTGNLPPTPPRSDRDVSAVLDLPAGIEYLHVPGACLGALFEGNQDLARAARNARQDLTYGLQLAVYEICANIVMHGYQTCQSDDGPAMDAAPATDTAPSTGGEACRIRVVFTVAQQPQRLMIDLYDTGAPLPNGEAFDITQVPEPNIAEPQIRGYGLYLIRQLTDEVVYEVQAAGGREGAVQSNSNHWRLTKFL